MSHLARWEMKNCTLLCEAHFQVEMFKTHQRQSTFGSCDVEKVHAVVARTAFPSQNVQSTSVSDRFWKLRCQKSGRRCSAKHISKSKCTKHIKTHHSRTTFGSWHVEKLHAVVARSTIPSQKMTGTEHFWTFRCRLAWPAQGIVHLVKSEQDVRVLSHFQKPWQAWDIWRGSAKMHFAWQARSTRDMFIRDVRRSGRYCPERSCILEHQIFSFGRMILCDRCSTSYDLASLFRGRRNTLETWIRKIATRIGTRLSALHSTFHFWRKSRRIASLFDVANFKNWGSLAELLRFWCCQLYKQIEDVSQKSFVFKLAGR